MKKKTFAIIGGGITGCTAALYINKLGHNVILYEKSDKLGGVAKDLIFKNQIYYNGPNYFEKNSLLIKILKDEKFFNDILTKNKILYKSYSDIFEKAIISEDFAHPVTSKKYTFKKKKIQKNISLSQKINYFPEEISDKIHKWCEKFDNKLNSLHEDCRHTLGIGRVHFSGCKDEVLKLKKRSKLYDDILGIPNFKKKKDYFIPRKGFNYLFKTINAHLIKNGVKIKFLSKINIKNDENKITFKSLNEKVIADYYIIASNPVPVIRCLKIGAIDNPITKYNVLSCEVNCKEKINNNYFQIFSKKRNIFRIYFFNLDKKNKAVIEIINNKNLNLDVEFGNAKSLIKKFNLKIKKKKNYNLTKQIRHNLFTIEDHKKFLRFEKICGKFNIIGGGWYLIGSKSKMDYIKNQIDKIL